MLHRAGADIPKPIALSGSAILMEYIGDDERSAPILNSIFLGADEGRRLFDCVMHNIEVFLSCNRVHADLSAFNILYHQGKLKIIDFPQSVDPRFNQNAFLLLNRDIHNVCCYFARYEVNVNALQISEDLWTRFLNAEL